jgi:glutathione S-transferase
MEVPRMLCAIAGKFPGDITDARHSAPIEGCACNLGRMPMAQIGDVCIGQSAAVNFAVASECGLMGDSYLEAAQILAIQEHVKEMQTAFGKICPWGTQMSEEDANKWFEGGATDTTGIADGSARDQRFLKWWAGRINECLGENGFAVGNKLSLADVLLYYAFAEELKDSECNEGFPQFRKEPMTSKARTAAVVDTCPRLKACIESVASNENFQKWLSMRGVQGF